MLTKALLIIILFIEISLIFQFTSRILSLSETQKRIDDARSNRDKLRLEYKKKQDELTYVQTDSYVEDIARRKLRYGLPNEHIYIVPADKKVAVELQGVRFEEVTFQEQISGQLLRWFNLFFK